MDNIKPTTGYDFANSVEKSRALIAEIEKVEVSEEEVEAEFTKIAESYHMEVEQVKMYIASEDLKKDLEVQKAADFVRDNAVITDVE